MGGGGAQEVQGPRVFFLSLGAAPEGPSWPCPASFPLTQEDCGGTQHLPACSVGSISEALERQHMGE